MNVDLKISLLYTNQGIFTGHTRLTKPGLNLLDLRQGGLMNSSKIISDTVTYIVRYVLIRKLAGVCCNFSG